MRGNALMTHSITRATTTHRDFVAAAAAGDHVDKATATIKEGKQQKAKEDLMPTNTPSSLACMLTPVPAYHTEYTQLECIGKGAYGKVYRAQHASGLVVALKKVKLGSVDEGVPPTIVREISTLRELPHQCVTQLYDVFFESATNSLCMVFECMDSDLRTYLERLGMKNECLSAPQVMSLFFQLVAAICFCHSHRILHRDLKPENLLISQGVLKVADFGLARVFTVNVRQYTQEVVTLWYRAPEILLGDDAYCTGVDMWAAGCIFAEIINGWPLFDGDSEISQLFKIYQVLGTPNEGTWGGVTSFPHYNTSFPSWKGEGVRAMIKNVQAVDELGLDLLERILVYDPNQRLSASACITHAYFSSLDEETKQLADF